MAATVYLQAGRGSSYSGHLRLIHLIAMNKFPRDELKTSLSVPIEWWLSLKMTILYFNDMIFIINE